MARPSERDEVLDLLALWYDDRAFFARYNQNDPSFRDELCLVARHDGALVATVQIFDRAVNLAGQRVPTGGIGSVFTRSDFRHQRVASALMRLAVETLERERFELSLLFAERLTFYNQFGWREINRKFSVLANAASIKAPEDPEIGIFDTSRDLRAVAALHSSYSGRFNGTAARDDAYWSGNLCYAGNQPLQPEGSEEYFVLCRDCGGIAAYGRVTRFHGVAMIMEYGYRPGAEPAMLAIFGHFGEQAAGAQSSFRLAGDHRRAALLRAGGSANPSTNSSVLVTHTAHDPGLESQLAAAGCS
ncbi:MAG TPA: GNAT family N-acetyltransferase, partial [Candidatus Binataceae bacterium]